jgi:spore germination cell wall hydrolase CwlJ-like protein
MLDSYLVPAMVALQLLYGPTTTESEKEFKSELNCLTENIIYEAGGEHDLGKVAVVEVTGTRKTHSKYPDDFCGVIWQHKQFSWTLTPEEYRSKPTDKTIEYAARIAVTYMLDKKLPDTGVKGSTHFINPDDADYIPEWYYVYEFMGKIGKHEFFRRPDVGEIVPEHKLKKRPAKTPEPKPEPNDSIKLYAVI